MKVIIGGYAQGKLAYVLGKTGLSKESVYTGELPKEKTGTVILNRFHEWVRTALEQGRSPETEIEQFLAQNSDCIIICDEIGNGIVPIDAFERAYRERTGRILITLAAQAEEVERVICGIGQRIK